MMLLQIEEPGGTRQLDLPCRIGGLGNDLVVPGASSGETASLQIKEGEFGLQVVGTTALRVGRHLLEPGQFCVLRTGDALTIGTAAIRVISTTPEQVSLSIWHLSGNTTLEPYGVSSAVIEDSDDLVIPLPEADDTSTVPMSDRPIFGSAFSRSTVIALVVAVLAVVTMIIALARLQPVQLNLSPPQTGVRGSGLSWQAADTLFVWPGERLLTASLEGYQSLERTVNVRKNVPLLLDLRLEPLPGVLSIDTGGIPATVFIDGAEAGRVPGEIKVAGGERTLLVRAERHLDSMERITVEGRGVQQSLSVRLQPSWGRLEVSATQPGARLQLEGMAEQVLPSSLELPAGVYRLAVKADGSKPWHSAVLVRGGEIQRVGPVTLGLPDAELRVTSTPSGADVLVGGIFRGRTPLKITVAAGSDPVINVSAPGYREAERKVQTTAGQSIAISMMLQPILVSLTVRGEPTNASVLVGGVARGLSPLTLELPAHRHILELRRDGSEARQIEVDLSSGDARTVDYRLVPIGRAADWQPPPAVLRAQSNTELRLISGGEFLAGSDRREQGRRVNEFRRRVILSRPFYIGIREVTNGEFRRFKREHASGFIGKHSLDLDGMAISNVSWSDAVQYCNWLSQQDGLAPAYEQQGGIWLLKRPVTTGYRLPSEAEWEYVLRHSRPGTTRRYEWGDALPPPAGSANLAGREAMAELPRVLEGWQDDYPVVGPPGRFPANDLGVFDLTGNVSEWVHEVYTTFDAGGAVTDPFGPSPTVGVRRVVKGSHWRTTNFAELRAAWRDGRSEPSQDLGFRVARYAE